jgi:hypothetical protein
LEHTSREDRIVRAFIEKQCKVVRSLNPTVRFGVLWIAASLDKRLRRCTDLEIGDLLVLVQERFDIFEPEFAICYHARQRLLRAAEKDLRK